MGGIRPSSGDDEVFAPPDRLLDPLTGQLPALGMVAVGGALGAIARYAAGLAVPHGQGTFPLATFLVNVVGCLVIGVLVVVVAEWRPVHPLMHPFLGTGVLGGFTTFSTYAVDAQQLLIDGRLGTALAYVTGTLVAAVAATWLGIRLARAAGSRR